MPKTAEKRLTDLGLKAIKPDPDARRVIPDGSVPGLAVIVQPSGTMSWSLRYRTNRNGERVQERVSLGPVKLGADGEGRNITSARETARAILDAADAGTLPTRDSPPVVPLALPAPLLALPSPEMIAASGPFSVGTIWAAYKANHLEANSRESTVKRFAGFFEKHALPGWRDRGVGSITKAECRTIINAANERGPEARNTAIVVLSSFFRWAVSEYDEITGNPVLGIKKTTGEDRDRYLTDAEIKIFWSGCDQLGPIFGPMFELMLLTGLRRSAVAGMRWDEISEGDVWTVPAVRMKTRKNKAPKPHAVYLTKQMQAVLAGMPHIKGSPFVFSRYGHAPSSGFSKAKADLDKLAPISPEWTLHDLRRTFTSGSAALGFDEDHIDRCTGHSLGVIRKKYNLHDYREEKTAVWVGWSKHIAKLIVPSSARRLPRPRVS